MTSHLLRSSLTLSLCAATGGLSSAIAQPALVQPPASPEAWAVNGTRAGPVSASKNAVDGGALLVLRCGKGAQPGLSGEFLHYGGTGLRAVDGQTERTLFEVRGGDWKEAFAVQLGYTARSGSWETVNTLAPVFVSSFSRGNTLTVRNSAGQEVFSFDLTGSTAAARALRDRCGFQYGTPPASTD